MKQFGFVIILIFLASLFGSLLVSTGIFATEHHAHNAPCPFMQMENSLCTMDAFEHLSAWINTFTTIVIELSLEIVSIAVAILVAALFRIPHSPPQILFRQLCISALHIPRSIEQLFLRQGILHPQIW